MMDDSQREASTISTRLYDDKSQQSMPLPSKKILYCHVCSRKTDCLTQWSHCWKPVNLLHKREIILNILAVLSDQHRCNITVAVRAFRTERRWATCLWSWSPWSPRKQKNVVPCLTRSRTKEKRGIEKRSLCPREEKEDKRACYLWLLLSDPPVARSSTWLRLIWKTTSDFEASSLSSERRNSTRSVAFTQMVRCMEASEKENENCMSAATPLRIKAKIVEFEKAMLSKAKSYKVLKTT